jgi:hypothetical protein
MRFLDFSSSKKGKSRKWCVVCNTEKPFHEFYGTHGAKCKECVKIARRLRYQENAEAERAATKERYHNNPEYAEATKKRARDAWKNREQPSRDSVGS